MIVGDQWFSHKEIQKNQQIDKFCQSGRKHEDSRALIRTRFRPRFCPRQAGCVGTPLASLKDSVGLLTQMMSSLDKEVAFQLIS